VVDPTDYLNIGRDEQLDREIDVDEFDDDLEDETIALTDDIPQIYTESYGTGVHEQPGFSQGGRTMRDRMDESNQASPLLTGGDVDANWQDADAVGDEAVGGSVSTPDQSVVDDLGAAVGLEMDDRAFLRTTEILNQRDDRRWELDPDSSEDYGDRKKAEDEDVE
jgi:hypothetical protein